LRRGKEPGCPGKKENYFYFIGVLFFALTIPLSARIADARGRWPMLIAATLGIMQHFRAYKPARENAAFLEVEHLDRRYLGKIFWPIPGEPAGLRRG